MMQKKETGYRFWSSEEDEILKAHVMKNGLKDVQKKTGLNRSDMSCRKRWQKYIEPFVNIAPFTPQEEAQVIHFHTLLGNNWDKIADEIPGRSRKEIKYFWTKYTLQTRPFGSTQQQVYVSEAPCNPDKTQKNSILAPASCLSQLPIVYPNPDMNSILAPASGSSQFPIVYPNPDMNSILAPPSGSSQLPIVYPNPDMNSILAPASDSSQLPIVYPNPDMNNILAPASGSSELPIVYPNPNMNSITQVPSITGINSEECSSNSGVCSGVSMPPLNEQVESDSSTDEDSFCGAVKRFLK